MARCRSIPTPSRNRGLHTWREAEDQLEIGGWAEMLKPVLECAEDPSMAAATEPSAPGRAWPPATDMNESPPARSPRFGPLAGGDVLGTANVLIVDDYDANVL